ncbi:hypothetical protein [Ferrovum sp. PN-J185]|uniref:hypothetical protein n=1 Tax=Ferrovum sp. PN-J185 TaxID=1356306 RepID=UPI0007973CA1|nr:hypothetical protein [Ferrovum sp. PN-J185]KXW55376.1 hypothetical protein FV185_16230 [Ferrovum sp. PN-J185]
MNLINEVQEINAFKKASLVIAKTLIGQADELAREHEEFNDRYIISGRKALYELLGKIYALAERLDRSIDREDQVAILRKVLSEKYGIRTQENTSDTTVLIRYITQADRKTAHVYSRAIETARLNKIDSSKFPEYVDQAGGVERIRSESACNLLIPDEAVEVKRTREKRLELARKYLIARTELPLASFKMGKKYLNTPKSASFMQFICLERDGRYFVLAEQVLEQKNDHRMLEQISDKFCSDLKRATNSVDIFYKKAMQKRRRRIIKEICRKRPELANGMLAAFRRKK